MPADRFITEEELAQHASQNDAWIALKGNVYDVTEFLKRHPGGKLPLMKGVGKDVTVFFNSIHPFVQHEKYLKGKQVGVIYTDQKPQERKSAGVHTVHKKEGFASLFFCLGPFKGKTALSEEVDMIIKEDTDEAAIITVRSFQMGENTNAYCIGWTEETLLAIKIFKVPPTACTTDIRVPSPCSSFSLTSAGVHKLDIVMKKPSPEPWAKSIEPSINKHALVYEDSRAGEEMFTGYLVYKEKINHNVALVAIQLANKDHIGVPLGYHIKMKLKGISRRYTPIKYTLLDREEPSFPEEGTIIFFIIKIYPEGAFTSNLDQLEESEVHSEKNELLIGCCGGAFDTNFFEGAHMLIMIAGGTGITPMVRIMEYLIKKRNQRPVFLIAFNKSEEDTIWRKDWKQLDDKYEWFHFVSCFTRVKNTSYLYGRITNDMLMKCLDTVSKRSKSRKHWKAIVCGPEGFNFATCTALEDITNVEDIFVFEG